MKTFFLKDASFVPTAYAYINNLKIKRGILIFDRHAVSFGNKKSRISHVNEIK
jgi:hypothetical protein